jgi:hypothetical protein
MRAFPSRQYRSAVGCRLEPEDRRLRVANVGHVKVVVHRPRGGAPKTATICRRSTGQ